MSARYSFLKEFLEKQLNLVEYRVSHAIFLLRSCVTVLRNQSWLWWNSRTVRGTRSRVFSGWRVLRLKNPNHGLCTCLQRDTVYIVMTYHLKCKIRCSHLARKWLLLSYILLAWIGLVVPGLPTVFYLITIISAKVPIFTLCHL